MAVLTLLISGCSKPEEVISSRLAQANKNLEAGHPEDAIRVLENLNERYPEHPAVLEALGFAYVQAGRNGAAASSFVRAADNDLASSSLRPLAAEAYLKEGAPERAAEQLRLYVAEYPGDYQIWQKLGEAEEAQGNLARAIDAYLEWYRIQPSGDAAFRLGTAFRRLNNAPQARSWFETTMRHAESHIDGALAGLLGLEVDARDFAAAELTLGQLERNFPEILSTLPDLPDIREEIARWKETQAAIQAARADQEQLARELAAARMQHQEATTTPPAAGATPPPADATASGTAAGAAAATTPPPTSPATSDSVIATTSASESATEVAGTAPLAADEIPASSAQTETGAASAAPPPSEPSPSGEPASPELARALARKDAGDLEGAVDQLQTALSYDDSNLDLWMELADCYRQLKQFPAAEAYLLEARRRAPDSIKIEIAYLNLGRESLSHDGYLARLDEARRRFPANVSLAYMLAHEFAEANVDRQRTAAAYEDFLLLAAADDPRRKEAEAYLHRTSKR